LRRAGESEGGERSGHVLLQSQIHERDVLQSAEAGSVGGREGRFSRRERLFIELMTSDRKLEASREGSKGSVHSKRVSSTLKRRIQKSLSLSLFLSPSLARSLSLSLSPPLSFSLSLSLSLSLKWGVQHAGMFRTRLMCVQHALDVSITRQGGVQHTCVSGTRHRSPEECVRLFGRGAERSLPDAAPRNNPRYLHDEYSGDTALCRMTGV